MTPIHQEILFPILLLLLMVLPALYHVFFYIRKSINKRKNISLEGWERCPVCGHNRTDDWWVPDDEWMRYIPPELWGSNLCVWCYLNFVKYIILKDSSNPSRAVNPLGEKK